MKLWRIAAVLTLATAQASAMEWLSADQLEQSCDDFLENPNNTDATLCLAFIQGFLAGADGAPSADLGDAVKPSKSTNDSFSDRAKRTRLGTIRLIRLQSETRSAYCVDESASPLEIVKTVARYLEQHEEALKLTNSEAVYAALVHEYPCES